MRKGITILGSTGSIGCNALEVIEQHPECFQIIGLTADKNYQKLAAQIREFKPRLVALQDKQAARKLRENLQDYPRLEILEDLQGICQVAAHSENHTVLNAMVGFAGLIPTLEAIKAGKEIALANKETLVAGGHLVIPLAEAKGCNILPVDSEHSAIWQCLVGNEKNFLKKIILTASGGPFLRQDPKYLKNISIQEATDHPNYQMGPKISVDSATLMNKGLEVIEALWLFNLELSQVEIVIHPESIVHSMIQMVDGSILAQLGLPDMKLPILFALTYPERLPLQAKTLDFSKNLQLTFEPLPAGKFPCLDYALKAAGQGHQAPIILNAANEIAVQAFLSKAISFDLIPDIIGWALDSFTGYTAKDLQEVVELDQVVREESKKRILKINNKKGIL